MTTNPATRPFWVVVGSGIDVRGIDVLGQIFDFSGIEKSEKSIKKTWQEFRDALSKGDFSFDDIASAKKNTFLRVYDDLFNKNAGIEYNTVLIRQHIIDILNRYHLIALLKLLLQSFTFVGSSNQYSFKSGISSYSTIPDNTWSSIVSGSRLQK